MPPALRGTGLASLPGVVVLLLAACQPAPAPPAAAPVIHLGSPVATAPTFVVRGGWADTSPDGFGRDPHEPVGPWAVFRDGEGVSVLDQVRLRILRYDRDGHPLGAVPIPSGATWDVAAAPHGGYDLLEWHPGPDPHWSVDRIDTSGAPLADTRVTLDPPTGVFVDGDRVLVEDRHGPTVDVATGERFPGRPTGDGRYLQATRDSTRQVTLTWSDATGGDLSTVRLATDRPLVNLVGLDPLGDEALVGLFFMEDTADRDAADPEIRVVRVDRRGHLLDELSLPAGVGIDPNRPLTLLPDGTVFHLRADHDGVTLGRVRR